MKTPPPGPDTLIVLSPDQATLYEFVKARQEKGGATMVILDRRRTARRTRLAAPVADRRRTDRRQGPPRSALALMSVLGFMILHRDGDRWVS